MSTRQIHYPSTRGDETVVDTYHGTQIKDPYRWLEDPDSPETQAWVKAQNEVTDSILQQCQYRKKAFDRIKAMQDFAKF